jgi:pimeloyl-ACP methyl ester carboxylesterase
LLAIARHDLTELFIAREQLIERPQFFQRKRRKRLASVLVHETTKPLMLGYASDVALYPQFQAYFRNRQPPLLAVWGRNDPFFLPAGAEAYRRDIPGADVRFFDTGHFALETHCAEIATAIRDFIGRTAAAAA